MPCDTITTQSVSLAQGMPGIVEHALRSLGWNISESTKTRITAWGFGNLTWTAGKGLTIRGDPGLVPKQLKAVTKAYSVQAVTWAAKRAGWSVQQTAEDKLTVSRR